MTKETETNPEITTIQISERIELLKKISDSDSQCKIISMFLQNMLKTINKEALFFGNSELLKKTLEDVILYVLENKPIKNLNDDSPKHNLLIPLEIITSFQKIDNLTDIPLFKNLSSENIQKILEEQSAKIILLILPVLNKQEDLISIENLVKTLSSRNSKEKKVETTDIENEEQSEVLSIIDDVVVDDYIEVNNENIYMDDDSLEDNIDCEKLKDPSNEDAFPTHTDKYELQAEARHKELVAHLNNYYSDEFLVPIAIFFKKTFLAHNPVNFFFNQNSKMEAIRVEFMKFINTYDTYNKLVDISPRDNPKDTIALWSNHFNNVTFGYAYLDAINNKGRYLDVHYNYLASLKEIISALKNDIEELQKYHIILGKVKFSKPLNEEDLLEIKNHFEETVTKNFKKAKEKLKEISLKNSQGATNNRLQKNIRNILFPKRTSIREEVATWWRITSNIFTQDLDFCEKYYCPINKISDFDKTNGDIQKFIQKFDFNFLKIEVPTGEFNIISLIAKLDESHSIAAHRVGVAYQCIGNKNGLKISKEIYFSGQYYGYTRTIYIGLSEALDDYLPTVILHEWIHNLDYHSYHIAQPSKFNSFLITRMVSENKFSKLPCIQSDEENQYDELDIQKTLPSLIIQKMIKDNFNSPKRNITLQVETKRFIVNIFTKFNRAIRSDDNFSFSYEEKKNLPYEQMYLNFDYSYLRESKDIFLNPVWDSKDLYFPGFDFSNMKKCDFFEIIEAEFEKIKENENLSNLNNQLKGSLDLYFAKFTDFISNNKISKEIECTPKNVMLFESYDNSSCSSSHLLDFNYYQSPEEILARNIEEEYFPQEALKMLLVTMYPTYLNVFFKENTRKYFDAWIISLFGENALKEQNKPQECIDASIEFVPPKFDILSPTQSLVDRASEIRSSLNGHKEEGWIKNIKKIIKFVRHNIYKMIIENEKKKEKSNNEINKKSIEIIKELVIEK